MERKLIELLIGDESEVAVEAISLVKHPAIEENFIFFSKEGKKDKFVSLASVEDEEKRMLIGPALIPDKHIPRYDELKDEEYDVYFSKDTVKQAAEMYLKQNRTNDHTFEHQDAIDNVSVVESWVVTNPEMDKSKHFGLSVPEGTWMVRVHVANDEMWKFVKEQEVQGFSIEGYFVDKIENMSKRANPIMDTLNEIKNLLTGKRKLYAEAKLEDGQMLVTDAEELAAGVEVKTIDEEGQPVEIQNGKYTTEAGVELEVFSGVLTEYNGEVKATEDKADEEVKKEELSRKKTHVKHRLALRKMVMEKYGNMAELRKLGRQEMRTLTHELVVFFENPDPTSSRADELLEFCERVVDPRGNIEIVTVGYVNSYEVEILFYNANNTAVEEVEAALYRAGYNVEYA